jgi:hypothetical protein
VTDGEYLAALALLRRRCLLICIVEGLVFAVILVIVMMQ